MENIIENGWQFFIAGFFIYVVIIVWFLALEKYASYRRFNHSIDISLQYTREQEHFIKNNPLFREMVIDAFPKPYVDFVIKSFQKCKPAIGNDLKDFITTSSLWFETGLSIKYCIVMKDGFVIKSWGEYSMAALATNFIGVEWRDSVAVIDDSVTSVAQATSHLSRRTVTAEMEASVFDLLRKRTVYWNEFGNRIGASV